MTNAAGSPALSITYQYDTGCTADPVSGKTFGKGRLCRVTDETGTTVYAYDRRGRVTSEQRTLTGGRVYLPILYQYDAAGRRTVITYPSGDKVTNTYDVNNRVTRIQLTPSGSTTAQNLLTSIGHRAGGPISVFTTVGGLKETRTLDTRYRWLKQRTTTTATPVTTVLGLNYGNGTNPATGYDKEGNLKLLDDVTPGAASNFDRTFGYDPDRYFLTSSTGPYGAAHASQTIGYTHDKTGNRLTENWSGIGTTSYTFKSDGAGHSTGVLQTITPPGQSAKTLNHLTTGDLQLDEVALTHAYDALGRLTKVEATDTGCSPQAKNVLLHDFRNQRVQRQVSSCGVSMVERQEDFLYGHDGSLYFRVATTSSGTVREAYIWLEGEPVAILRSGPEGTGTYFLHNDHLGRPLAMSNTTAQLVWRGEYEPFGRGLAPRINTLNISPGFRFPGQWEPSDSGDVPGGKTGSLGSINALIDNWHRTYVPRWGRYSQADPIGLRGGTNLYSYAFGNPLAFIDPAGKEPLSPADFGHRKPNPACCDVSPMEKSLRGVEQALRDIRDGTWPSGTSVGGATAGGYTTGRDGRLYPTRPFPPFNPYINPNITDPCSRYCTLAHELAHYVRGLQPVYPSQLSSPVYVEGPAYVKERQCLESFLKR